MMQVDTIILISETAIKAFTLQYAYIGLTLKERPKLGQNNDRLLVITRVEDLYPKKFIQYGHEYSKYAFIRKTIYTYNMHNKYTISHMYFKLKTKILLFIFQLNLFYLVTCVTSYNFKWILDFINMRRLKIKYKTFSFKYLI